jgi:UDP-glucose 6-dehydrogenase
MATKKLTALQIFKETKRLDAIEAKAKQDRAALHEKVKTQNGTYNKKLAVDGVVYKLNTDAFGEIWITKLGTVEEFIKILDTDW